jgi:hypothetical protein
VIARWRLAVALIVASAFSSFPSAFYATIATEVGGGSATTSILFASHGVAAIVAMSVLAIPAVTAAIARFPLRLYLTAVLGLDALAGILLVFASGNGQFALVLAGRIVTGIALGALTPVVAAALAGYRGGSALSTAGILGGVGVGSLVAGSLALLALPRAAVFSIGCFALIAAAAIVLGSAQRLAVTSDGTAAVSMGTSRFPLIVVGSAALAFAANGVLGLFTSVLPGIVAGASTAPPEFTAGLTVAVVLLAAGAARLIVPADRSRFARWLAVALTCFGAVVFGVGLAGSSIALSLTGGVLLGFAAGIAYDTALALAASRTIGDARVRALATVQRGGQFGLVIPVLLYPLAIQR